MIDGRIGMFATWQFSLFKNLMSRLRTSEFRTSDPSLASAFVVPYDAGVHSFIDHTNGKVRLASPHGWTASELLTKASKTANWRRRGHDHFVIFSVTGYQMVGIGTKMFFMNICENCTVLTIESTPNNIAISGRTKKYWYSVPYPSSYHWWEGLEERPWRVKESGARDILAIFIGSVKTKTASSNALRRALYSECNGRSSDCQWHSASHSCTGVLNQSDTMLLYLRSKYCLAPPGDSLTRKSIFDSYLTGCVPVVFARASLSQYSWHLSPEDIEQSTVYIPKLDVVEGRVSVLNILSNIGADELLAKQEAIARIAPRLQYSVVPDVYGGESSVPKLQGAGSIWAPPQRDAADVIIDRILDQETVEPLEGFSAQRLKELQVRQKEIMETDPDYMGMAPLSRKKKRQNLGS
eukprot:CAMPEP_0185031692 /NCGR_PEP_ID=MMETSP1103-20130426/19309_1 /TAXON_ID=36769 /ORGANISM="Paraphysomonas bandaiensis, Strain Caron Lab Isolate" /LENGTH=408 /DNA_ID=CAMNT_0027567305 /DNA_START=255 /DNA_END=1481 /DNA_ORIENTATION=-